MISRLLLLLSLLLAGLGAGEARDLERMARACAGLPVLHDGRMKPFASVARHALLSLSGRSRLAVEGGAALSATAWLLEGLADPAAASARRAIRLRNPEVGQALGLAERQPPSYSADEVIVGLAAHQSQLEPLLERNPKELGPAEAQLVELYSNLARVVDLLDHGGLANIPGPASNRELWQSRQRTTRPDALQMAAIAEWTALLTAVRAGDAAAVEGRAASLSSLLAPVCASARLDAEVAYHRLAPFTWSLACDLLTLILLGVGLAVPSRWPWRLAVASLALGTVLHLGGLGLRVWIMQRPPVATLYETLIFVGAVAALLGLGIEWFRRQSDGAFVGATLAAILHLIAFSYADDGDTMGMLVAVLNSNFWLTIHVLTITAGYGCTLAAGLAAHVALAARALHPTRSDIHQGQDRVLLGLALVSLLFTLFGTILGGIWADQSWGRFWGWDPKENGALLIVLWLLMLLHLRLSGLAGGRGFACGLILGNIVVAVAWFGVNLLGIGLHSYGFASGTFWALIAVAALEVGLGLGLWIAATRRARV